MTKELLEKANELEKKINELKADLNNFERFNKEEGNCYFEKDDKYVRVPAEVMQECAALAEQRMVAMLKEAQEEFAQLGNETPTKEIKVGDVVRVISSGKNYSADFDFFATNEISVDIAARYKYGGSVHDGVFYKVVGVGTHKSNGEKIYVLEDMDSPNCVHLINYDGVEKIIGAETWQ